MASRAPRGCAVTAAAVSKVASRRRRRRPARCVRTVTAAGGLARRLAFHTAGLVSAAELAQDSTASVLRGSSFSGRLLRPI